MNVREAKDFLVHQTADQAERDGVPLSELDKRVMYFTDSAEAIEESIELNEEFEAQYDTAEYETKIARLLGRVYQRLKHDDPETARTCDVAVRELQQGDHYILVMWSARLVATNFWKTMGASLVLVVVMVLVDKTPETMAAV